MISNIGSVTISSTVIILCVISIDHFAVSFRNYATNNGRLFKDTRPDTDNSVIRYEVPSETSLIQETFSSPYRNMQNFITKTSHPQKKLTASPCDLIPKTEMDCSSRGLTAVPKPISINITHLNLFNNSIDQLDDLVFINYTNLLVLNISCNILNVLNNCSFCGLPKLKFLDLWNNSLSLLKKTYPDDVFKPLQKLEYLWINMNSKNCTDPEAEYPDKALSLLVNLKYLYIDGLANKTFGDGFRNLTRLTNLTLAGYLTGYCNLSHVRNTTFHNLQHVTYLDVSNCYITRGRIEFGTFESLTQLEVLNISHNEDLDFENLTTILNELRSSKLKILVMQLVTNRYSYGSCIHSGFVELLPRTLEYIDARENNFIAVDREAIGKLPTGLKMLDLSGNIFRFATYFKDFHLMGNLTSIRINGAYYLYSLPKSYPFLLDKLLTTDIQCTSYSLSSNNEDVITYDNFELSLPTNLESIEMKYAGLRYKLTQLQADSNNNLKNLTLRGNYFPSLEGPFIGFNQLEFLDLSDSYIHVISNNFFTNFTSLQSLDLNSNFLGYYISGSSPENIFSSLNNLQLLDLSFNAIDSLPTNIFCGLTNLTSLNLSRNEIANFSCDISYMNNLEQLDLHKNYLSRLPLEARQHIDSLLQSGVEIKVDMSETDILCDCGNLDFLEWMTSSKAFDHGFHGYYCVNPDTSRVEIKDGYNKTITVLRRQCISHVVMFLIIGSVTVLVLFVLIGMVIYRFRWKLRYLYYGAYLFYKKRGNKKNSSYEYDVFICYENRDNEFVRETLLEQLQRRDLKVCIHDRDFKTGDFIGSNIINAICSSQKMLVVITQNFISSPWCNYEIQMANQESVHTGRQVLVFLLKEKIKGNICNELRYNISNNTYIAYPEYLSKSVEGMKKFWDKLTFDLKD